MQGPDESDSAFCDRTFDVLFQATGVHGMEVLDGQWVYDVHNNLTLHLGWHGFYGLYIVVT